MAHITEIPKPPSTRAELPAALDAPVLRMLAKVPADRPATAGEALGELSAAAEQAGVNLATGTSALLRPVRTLPSTPQLATTVDASVRSSQRPRAQPLVQSGGRTPDARRRTGLVLALAIVVAISAYLYGTREPAPVAREPASVAAPVEPAAAPAVMAPAMLEPAMLEPAVLAPAMEPPDAEPPRQSQPAKLKRKRRAARADDIPRDLENPF